MRRRKARSEADIASRKSSKQRKLDGDFLEGTESNVGFEEAAPSKGFQEAWNADHVDRDASLDAALDGGQGTSTLDSLDRGRKLQVGVALVVIAVAGVAAFILTQRSTQGEAALPARGSFDSTPNILASPLDEREYVAYEAPAFIEGFTPLNSWFLERDRATGPELVVGEELEATAQRVGASLDNNVVAGALFWGNRLHVALLSDGRLRQDADCIVVSLVSEELNAVDVAGQGPCGDQFEATGDRLACAGQNVVLLEVWPLNPDAVSEPPPVTAIRIRIETISGDEVLSRRGVIELPGPAAQLVSGAAALAGLPGETVEIGAGELQANCELIDRSSIDVRLLPG